MSNSLSVIVPGISTPNLSEAQAPATPVKPASNSVVSLAPFLALVRELSTEVIPVRLRTEFRDELQRELLAAARQQYARDLLIWSTPAPAQAKTSRRWVLGAATVGLGSAVSLASIVTAYYLRHRHRQAA
jgi:hypothetical protein